MAFGQGMNEALYMGAESAFKTPGVTAYKLPLINPKFSPSVNRFRSEALTGSAQPRPIVFGKVAVDASFDLECNKQSLGPPLKALMGTPVDYGLASGIFDHFFSLGTQASWAFEERHTDVSQNFLWKGCYLGAVDFGIDAEGLMKATFSGMGANQTNEGATTQFSGSITDLTGSLPFSYLLATLKQGGVAIAYGQAIRLRINRGLDKRMHIDGSSDVGVIFSQIADVSGTIRVSFQDKALLDLALAGTETSLEFFVPETTTGHGVQFTMPTVILQPTSPITNGTGLNDIEFTFDAYARGTASDTAAEAGTRFIGAAVLSLNTKTLVFKVDGGGNQTITFTVSEVSPATVVTKINATMTGGTSFVENGRVILQSSTKGTTSSIAVQASSTSLGLTDLGLDVLTHVGLSAQSIVIQLANDLATV